MRCRQPEIWVRLPARAVIILTTGKTAKHLLEIMKDPERLKVFMEFSDSIGKGWSRKMKTDEKLGKIIELAKMMKRQWQKTAFLQSIFFITIEFIFLF